MNETLKEIGIWYFNTGWLFGVILGIPVGVVAGRMRKLWILVVWWVLVFVIGGVLFYAKYA